MRHAVKLARKHDFAAFQETHSSIGKADALKLPRDMTAVWSDGTNRQAGVGLIMNNAFLENFNPIRPTDWNEIDTGRAAVLRLSGKYGNMDIFVIYLHTGEDAKAERRKTWMRIKKHIQPKAKALTVLTGDFNYVCDPKDRVNKADGSWSGAYDKNDEEFFQDNIATPFELFELSQEQFTCETAQARSRIDRVYTNQHLTEQLDRIISCSTLEWVKDLSAHRPVSFGRTSSRKSEMKEKPLPTSPMDNEDWERRVNLEFGERLKNDDAPELATRRLLLLKQAIKHVTHSMAAENQEYMAQTHDDKYGWTMRIIRAAEENSLGKMEKCIKAYPHLGTIIHARPDVRTSEEMNAVRKHAIEMARAGIMEEIASLQHGEDEGDEMIRKQKKENILTRLKRLTPGACTGLNAMVDDNGKVTIDPEEMAGILRKHWSKTFAHKEIDKEGLHRWLRESGVRDDMRQEPGRTMNQNDPAPMQSQPAETGYVRNAPFDDIELDRARLNPNHRTLKRSLSPACERNAPINHTYIWITPA